MLSQNPIFRVNGALHRPAVVVKVGDRRNSRLD
jgi:hypothetical protein